MNPYRIIGPTCLSFSGGRTSGYMLHKVLQNNSAEDIEQHLKVVFANTGKEEEATLEFVRDCGKRWGVPITWVEYFDGAQFNVVEFSSASRQGEPFEAVIRQRGGYLPNRVARFCSSELKTRTMHRYLRSIGWQEWDTFIGIRADEPRRVAKFAANKNPEGKHEEVWMPLARAGVGADEVGQFWRECGFDLGLPNMNGKTMHGNCDLCFLKPASQVLSLIAEKPERAIWWATQEKRAEQFADSASRFRDDRPSYAEMADYAAKQVDMFNDEEAIPCFCGD